MVLHAKQQCVRRVRVPHFMSLCTMFRPFQAMRSPQMESFLTENRGWGVRASQPIRKGTFIVEYAGKAVGADVYPVAPVLCEAAAAGKFMLLAGFEEVRAWPSQQVLLIGSMCDIGTKNVPTTVLANQEKRG